MTNTVLPEDRKKIRKAAESKGPYPVAFTAGTVIALLDTIDALEAENAELADARDKLGRAQVAAEAEIRRLEGR